jgi:hypothetical protein
MMENWNAGKLEYQNGWPMIKAVFQIASLHYSNIPVFHFLRGGKVGWAPAMSPEEV